MRKFIALLAALFALTIVAACGGNEHGGKSGGHDSVAKPPAAGADRNAVDVRFAKDMIPHHAQAIEMAEKVTGEAFDKMFLDMMIRHHEGALEMAMSEQKDGKHPEAKVLAATIEKAQAAENAEMKTLLGTS